MAASLAVSGRRRRRPTYSGVASSAAVTFSFVVVAFTPLLTTAFFFPKFGRSSPSTEHSFSTDWLSFADQEAVGGNGVRRPTVTLAKDGSPIVLPRSSQAMDPQVVETPLDQWLQDIETILSSAVSNSLGLIKNEKTPQTVLTSTIPSGQNQIPVGDRIAKAVHEECLPWIVTSILSAAASAMLHSTLPLSCSVSIELAFLTYCSLKILFSFNKPTTPQPMLEGRDWDYVRESVWSSHSDIGSRRSFLMGWFYDAPFEDLRREDALCFLSWMRYGFPIEGDYLNEKQIKSLVSEDLTRLEEAVNSGKSLPPRREGEPPLGCMRFSIEPLRYRHKPLVFYGITHGAYYIVRQTLQKEFGFTYTPAADPKKDIGYWYRAPSCTMEDSNPPLVFVHGVGGISFYYSLLNNLTEEMISNGDKTPIILLDLPQVSLRINDDIPSIVSSVESVCKILDKTVGSVTKATMVGHSFGSILLSWMIQSRPDRVSNCIFLDPVCFQIHQKDILFNFHMQRVDSRKKGEWGNPFSVGSVINLAGTEMHTNNAMLRHFWWASNALWPSDILENDVSACVLLSQNDEIVPSADVAELFDSFNRGKKSTFAGWDEFIGSLSSIGIGEDRPSSFVKAKIMEGASHGDFVFDDDKQRGVIRSITAMHRLNTIKHHQRLHKSKEADAFVHLPGFTNDVTFPDIGQILAQSPFAGSV